MACAAVVCIFASMCTSVTHGNIIILSAVILIITGMSLLYHRQCLYRNHIISGIFIVTVLCVTYLHGLSYKKITQFDLHIDDNDSTPVSAQAVVVGKNVKDSYVQLILRNTEISLKTQPEIYENDITIIGNVNDFTVKTGDRVRFEGDLKRFDSARNEGNFDSELYYRSVGIKYKVNIKKLSVIDEADSINNGSFNNSNITTGKLKDGNFNNENSNPNDGFNKETGIINTYKRKLYYKMSVLKERLKNVYLSISDEDNAGIYTSMILGDKSILDADIKQMYQKNGIAHLLAISGLHISLIGMTLYNILRKAGITFLKSALISSVIILSYGIMTGNAISTRRAVIMLIISFAAQIAGRTYDIRSSLSAAAIILVYDNPYVIENSAFQLSFGAVAGIALVYPALDYMCSILINNKNNSDGTENGIKQIDKKDRVCKLKLLNQDTNENIVFNAIKTYIKNALIISLSVNIITMPVVIYNYFEFPPYSIVLNMAVIPLMSLLMMCAVLAGIIGMFNIPAGRFVIGTSHYILEIYDRLCGISEKMPYSTIVTGRPEIHSIIVYYILILIFILAVYIYENVTTWYYTLKKDNNSMKEYGQFIAVTGIRHIDSVLRKIIINNKKTVVGICLMIAAAFIILFYRNPCGFEVDMLDVGQGDGIVVRLSDDMTYMFDGGSTDIKEVGKYRIMPFLKSKGIDRIDCVTISHSDADHVNGIIELINMTDNTFSIKNIILPDIKNKSEDKSYCEIENAAVEHGINVEYIKAGDVIYKGRVVSEDSLSDNKSKDGSPKYDISEISDYNGQDYVIKCVHPTPDYDYSCANDYSASYMISYGRFKMLMMGDSQETAEKYMLDNNRLCDISVLKTGHHGSSTSSSEEFLDKIKPEAAIISCGINNRYHHPSEKVMTRLHDKNVQTMVTAESGQIIIRSDGERFTVSGYKL